MKLRILDAARLDHPGSVVIVGASCVGKTTLVDELRRANLPGIEIPQRYVTRAGRSGDHPAESGPITVEQLQARAGRGELAVWWQRSLEHGRIEHYGFARSPAGTLPIYSANNAILTGALPPGVLDRALVIGITAPDAERRARLLGRSPDLARDHPDEVAHRLAERTEDLEPLLHVMVDNCTEHAAVAAAALVELVRSLDRALRMPPK